MMVEHFPMVISGALIGLSVAAPIGPMGVLCINRTLAEGMTIGVITGLGASTVQACYGAIVFLGLSEAGPLIERNSRLMSIGGATLMILFSLKLLRARPAVRSPKSGGALHVLIAYGSAVVFNLSNPLTVVLLIAAVTSIFGSLQPSRRFSAPGRRPDPTSASCRSACLWVRHYGGCASAARPRCFAAG